MPQLKVGVVGCGRMGRERARCSHALDARIEVMVDVDRNRSMEMASQYGAKAAAGADDCFRAGVDAIFVCTAPGSRGPLELSCIESGTPFLVEKPVGISAEPSSALLRELRQRPVVNAVGYMNRYRKSVQLAREILSRSTVIGVSAHWVCKPYGVAWWTDERSSGGPHNEQATHLFDLMRFLLGEIVEIESMFQGPSRVSSVVKFRSGAIGTVFYSCDAQAKDIGLHIFAREGSVTLSGWDFAMTGNTIDGVLPAVENEDIFLAETRTFLEAVRLQRRDLIQSDFADASKTQRVMDAARQSSFTGRAVQLSYPGSGA